MDHNAPEADGRNVPDDVISVSDGETDQESSLGEESSYACDSSASEGKESSDSEPAMSEVSDQYSMLEHACQSIQNVFSTTSEGKLVGGDGSLNQLESLPGHWSLAKLTLPLKFGLNRLDGLLVGYLMELRATHSDPSRCREMFCEGDCGVGILCNGLLQALILVFGCSAWVWYFLAILLSAKQSGSCC